MSRSQFPLSDSQMQALPAELRGVLKTVIDFYDAQMTDRVARPPLAVGLRSNKMNAPCALF